MNKEKKMKIKKKLMFVITSIVLFVGIGLILRDLPKNVEVNTEIETETKTESNITQDDELLNILTNNEPVPSDGSMTMTGIFIKRSEKKN